MCCRFKKSGPLLVSTFGEALISLQGQSAYVCPVSFLYVLSSSDLRLILYIEYFIISDYASEEFSVIWRWAGLRSIFAFMKRVLINYSGNDKTAT